MSSLGWLSDGSTEVLRTALEEICPELAARPLVVNERVVTSDPRFFQASAVIDDAFIVKFAWSEPAARRIAHEGAILSALARVRPRLPLPEVAAASPDPAVLVTRLVRGGPVTFSSASALSGARRDRLVEDLADFLAALHQPRALACVAADQIDLAQPEPQADTDSLRARFGQFVGPGQRRLVAGWCDWVDTILAAPTEAVLLHGDLHGHNLVWDSVSGSLLLVADLEMASLGDPAYDFRYLPAQAATPYLFIDVAGAYERVCGRRIVHERVMAWHVRTALGDALWRSEAGVPLPGGGTPALWVEELAVSLGILCR